MVRTGVLGLCLLALSNAGLGAADAKPSEELDKKARELVRKLGDPAFRKREAAAKELLAMGSNSLPALEASLHDPDAEIRERCQQLLPLAYEADMRWKIIQFGEDKLGQKNISLPGWKKFSQMAGTDEKARKFFTDMITSNVGLLQHVESDPKKAAQMYMSRCSDFGNQQANMVFVNINGIVQRQYQQPPQPKLHEFAALLLVNSEPKVEDAVNNGGGNNYYSNVGYLLYQPYIRTFLNDEKDGAIFKKVFMGWLDAQIEPYLTPSKSPNRMMSNNLTYAMQAIQNNDLKEAVGFVEKVVGLKELQGYWRGQAICTLAKFSEPKHIKLLEPLLKDETVITTINFGGVNNKPITVQVRDVALGITIHLKGEKPASFDFDGMKEGRYGNMGNNVFYPYAFGFEDDTNRKSTFKKWDEFVAKKAKEGEKKSEQKK